MLGVLVNRRCRSFLLFPLLFCVFILFVQCRIALADTGTNEGGAGDGASTGEMLAPIQPDTQKTFWSDVQLSGYLKNASAYRYRAPRSITKIRNVAYINAKYPYSPHLKFNFSGWAYYDMAYNLFDYDTIAARFERNSSEPLAFLVTLPSDD